ncbi:MAG: xylose isomerase [Firmicutes bacterium]|nr:xylose isomerase [Bacillota bacterium]
MSNIGTIKYEGAKSTNPLSFKFYNPTQVVGGKTMREQLKFAMSYWHTLCSGLPDIFGEGTIDKSFGKTAPMDIFKAKADFGFEFMKNLGVDYYCFHDNDIAPHGKNLTETLDNIQHMAEYLKSKQKESGIKLLWGTANNFSEKMFMSGAATSPNADVFAIAAAKVKTAIDCTILLGGTGYVFWGGREGYDSLLNTNLKLELDNLAKFLTMARDYARANGFNGDFYIEPKPKEPTKHQYDFDVATCIGFLRQYGLDKDFKLNIEGNHATLAGHTFEHELALARINGMFGSIDANEGDYLLGWDTDCFPKDVLTSTYVCLDIIRAGGFTNGGLNFDAKCRRQSNTIEDLYIAYILGMDTYALGLLAADKIIKDGRIDNNLKTRYASYTTGIGKQIVDNKIDLATLAKYARDLKSIDVQSGKQEYLESVINNIIYGGI